MDKKKFIFWSMVFICCVLLFVQWKLTTLGSTLAIDCKETFDINATCPCQKIEPNAMPYFLNVSFNLSQNISIY